VTARIVLLITAGLAFAAVFGLAARTLSGDTALLYCATAVLICLLPAVATLAWLHRAMQRQPQLAALLALGFSGVRMFAVLAVAIALHLQVPFYHGQAFLVWVLGAYFYLLTAETLLLVVGRPAASDQITEKPGA
jgi:hypothetical protein